MEGSSARSTGHDALWCRDIRSDIIITSSINERRDATKYSNCVPYPANSQAARDQHGLDHATPKATPTRTATGQAEPEARRERRAARGDSRAAARRPDVFGFTVLGLASRVFKDSYFVITFRCCLSAEAER